MQVGLVDIKVPALLVGLDAEVCLLIEEVDGGALSVPEVDAESISPLTVDAEILPAAFVDVEILSAVELRITSSLAVDVDVNPYKLQSLTLSPCWRRCPCQIFVILRCCRLILISCRCGCQIILGGEY